MQRDYPRWLRCLSPIAALLLLPAWVPAGEEEPLESILTERVTVTTKRLPAEAEPLEQIPANVTVISRERIETSGAQTLQDLLALEAGVVLYDQVGNDIQKTVELRGYAAGTSTKVYLNGAPLNATRNNTAHLELIPLGSLERIEISRGAVGAVGGGGAEAGSINLVTRRGGETGGTLALVAGSDATRQIAGEVSGQFNSLDLLFSVNSEESDGFRQNAGGERRQFLGSLGFEITQNRRLDLAVLSTRNELGNPGALTLDEFATDPESSPFNVSDFFDESFTQSSLNYRDRLPADWALAANLFFREADADSLSTGRSASIYGGFHLQSRERTIGSTIQFSRDYKVGGLEGELTAGLEWLEGDTDAAGFSTAPEDPTDLENALLVSDNTAERRTEAIFVQSIWHPRPHWNLLVGLRGDRDRVGYDERVPLVGNSESRSYEELSLRVGLGWVPQERYNLYVNFGQAFLPPTVEQLFSFREFGSNPRLKPQDSSSLEGGLRLQLQNGTQLDIALFHIETENEIVFDPDSELGLFGANENIGKTRRQGIELSWRGRLLPSLDLYSTLTLTSAQIRNGADRGNRVPLVPRERVSLGLNWRPTSEVALRLDLLHVGEQVLANDEPNLQELLTHYTVVNTRLSWRRLFIRVTNLFDEKYATRGISALDYEVYPAIIRNIPYLTPAPGRRLLAGIELKF